MTKPHTVKKAGPRKNSYGFTVLTTVILLAILIAAILIVPGALSRRSKLQSIKKQVDGLHISADLQSKTCSSGDPINNPAPFCTYSYTDYGGQVVGALTKAGYIEDTQATHLTDNGVVTKTYAGGDPQLRIEVGTYKGITTITAKRAH